MAYFVRLSDKHGQSSGAPGNSRFFAPGTTPLAVIDFQQSPQAQERALELLELAKQGHLKPEQESELDHFTELEHILRMAKAHRTNSRWSRVSWPEARRQLLETRARGRCEYYLVRKLF